MKTSQSSSRNNPLAGDRAAKPLRFWGAWRFATLLTLGAFLILAPCKAAAQTASSAPKADKPAAGGTMQVAGKAPAGNAQNGRKIFVSDGCYECHGREAQGQGGVVTGPSLAPHPIPFATLVSYVRQPTGEMPPYTKKVISDAELADIYAFLQSIPDAPKPDSIPLLK
jgi:mono/diheme cytochrome c family protein